MRIKRIFQLAVLLLSLSPKFFAEENQSSNQQENQQKGNLGTYLTIDAAYYPESEYRTSSAHLSKLTGVYYGLEGRATLGAEYAFSTPLGGHWLLRDANVAVGGAIEVSPVTVKPKLSVSFTPLPFLVLSAGGDVGTGWTLLGWEGMSVLDKTKSQDEAEYDDLAPFRHFYYDFWIQGTFQFDTGAIWAGDWTHVLFLAGYQVKYAALTGVGDDEIWEWQASDNKANGWQFYTNAIIAYQMPKMVSRVGFLFELEGHYDKSDYAVLNNNDYKGDFKTASISPFAQVKFNERNALTVLASVSSRRAFKEEHDETTVEPYLNYVGYEWYFRRIALSYTHKF
ncbi:MAG: hypothetical protein IJ717_12450 [Treponema sp.]|nr:hypothetical protein [Treponema sp.]